MTNGSKHLVLGLGLSLLVASSAAPLAAESTRQLERTFRLPDERPLRLVNLMGSVTVRPAEGDQVRVRATIHAEGRDAAETRELLSSLEWIQARDHGKRVWGLSWPTDRFDRFRHPREEGWGHTRTRYLGERVTISRRGGPLLYADLEIAVPRGSGFAVRNVVGPISGGETEGSFHLDTGSGTITLSSHTGRLDLDTGSGNIRVGRVDGEADLDTGSGDVEVGELRGDADIDTGSGDIRVRSIEGRTLNADTGSGSVRVEHARLQEIEADTGSGDVQLLDMDARRIDADTGSGDVTVAGPLAMAESIDLDTGSGDVRIQAGSDASFRLEADQGSGDLESGYEDARPIIEDRMVVGYERGDGRTRIAVDTGSGDCVIEPR